MQLNRILSGRLTTPDPDEHEELAGHYRMFVRDLELGCSIGVYDHEKASRQQVRINADLLVKEPGSRAASADDIRHVMSYETVIEGIKSICAAGHINLVETMAEEIAAMCLDDRRVSKVLVRIEKLEIEPNAAGIGIEIVRYQSAPSLANVHPLYGARRPRSAGKLRTS